MTRSIPTRRWARSSRQRTATACTDSSSAARATAPRCSRAGSFPTGRARSIRRPSSPPTNDAEIAQEEVFGPVVTVIPFEDEKDAIRIANDVRYGLMATIWTGDPARGHRIAARIKSGTVGINMPYTAFPGIPFGGYKQSGFGRELALETLDLYLETKSVIVSTGARPINPFGL